MTDGVRALLLAGGSPPYVDPWHPFAATADRFAALMDGLGWSVERADDPARRIAAGLDGVDVLLTNAPAPEEAPAADLLEAADQALAAFLARGGGAVGLHIGVTALAGLDRWNRLTGARWVQGVSGHPPLGPCTVDGPDGPVELVDERYTDLALEGEREVRMSYSADGRVHPLLWRREAEGARVLADCLGHDPRSFDSSGHVDELAAGLRWASRR